MLTSGSLFTGIAGFDEGFRRAGIKTLWMAEKEPFCQAILRTHFPEAELFGDVTYVTKRSARAVDIITAGFPCQDVSVAGKRAGLAGARTGLFWEVIRILGELRPPWFVLENVPGLFSSNEGRDFAVILDALDECGYGMAWRVLNSQFFGVAQRRRRVFIVGCFGKPCPAEILFEPQSGSGDFAEGGEAWPDIAVPLTSGSGVTSNRPGRRAEDDYNLAYCLREDPGGIGQGHNTTYAITGNMRNRSQGPASYVAAPITASYGKQLDSSDRNGGPPNIVQQAISSKWAKGSSGPAGDEYPNLTVAFNNTGQGWWNDAERASTIRKGDEDGNGDARMATLISSPADTNRVRSFASLPEGLDSARYRALGNAVTASVAEWIGRRIVSAHR